jgi:predicted nucleic acid-binding protein
MSLLDDIRLGSLVAIDTVIWIYEFETNPIFGPITDELFQNGFGSGHCRAGCSLLALGELLVQPLAVGRLDIADEYRRIIVPSPQLTVWDLDREVIETAAVLRARYRVRLLDAIHVACAVVHGAHCFLTNDEGLRRIQEVPILILADYVPLTP